MVSTALSLLLLRCKNNVLSIPELLVCGVGRFEFAVERRIKDPAHKSLQWLSFEVWIQESKMQVRTTTIVYTKTLF